MKKRYLGLLIGLVIVLIVGCVVYFVFRDKKPAVENKDAVKFSEEYTQVGKDNLFVYRSGDEIVNILEKGTGIVYLGFEECGWCQAYVPMLNEVAKEEKVEKIYYFDIREDRANNTEAYQKIVELLGKNLLNDDEGNPRVFVPDVTFVKKGEIVGHDNETSTATEAKDGTPQEYWTNDKKSALKDMIRANILKLDLSSCETGCDL